MAEIDRLRSGKIFTLSWILFWSITAKADQIEDLTLNGLGAEANHLLIYNPAASYSGKRMISALAYLGSRDSSVIASPQNGAQRIDYENEIKGTGAAFSVPLGGASFGLHFFELREELKAQNDAIQRTIEELQVSKDYAFRFIVELSGNLRGGFLYQVKAIENDIFGSFFVNGNDRTVFKGQMAGYRLGVFYEESKYAGGVFTAPALRGKGTIEGEQKILTEPGSAGADVFFRPNQKLSFGISFVRWFYKRDERGELSTSPEDQRSISLNGLSLRQFLFKTDEFHIGATYELKKGISVGLNLGRSKGVFLFDESSVPGDNRNREKDTEIDRYSLFLRYQKNQFSMELVRMMESIAQDQIRDPTGKLGHGSYQDYVSDSEATVLRFTFAN